MCTLHLAASLSEVACTKIPHSSTDATVAKWLKLSEWTTVALLASAGTQSLLQYDVESELSTYVSASWLRVHFKCLYFHSSRCLLLECCVVSFFRVLEWFRARGSPLIAVVATDDTCLFDVLVSINKLLHLILMHEGRLTPVLKHLGYSGAEVKRHIGDTFRDLLESIDYDETAMLDLILSSDAAPEILHYLLSTVKLLLHYKLDIYKWQDQAMEADIFGSVTDTMQDDRRIESFLKQLAITLQSNHLPYTVKPLVNLLKNYHQNLSSC